MRACRACDAHLPLGPRPVVQAGATARILVVGQAPGAKMPASGVPWDDKSVERLRDWMSVGSETFYDKAQIAILPMGFCCPGRAASGDLPPRRECAELRLDRLLVKRSPVESYEGARRRGVGADDACGNRAGIVSVVVGLLALSPHRNVAARLAVIVIAHMRPQGIGLSFGNKHKRARLAS